MPGEALSQKRQTKPGRRGARSRFIRGRTEAHPLLCGSHHATELRLGRSGRVSG